MINAKMMETVADISYIAGYHKHYSGDSRLDISQYIRWAIEFENIHQKTDWSEANYMQLIETYTEKRIGEEQGHN